MYNEGKKQKNTPNFIPQVETAGGGRGSKSFGNLNFPLPLFWTKLLKNLIFDIKLIKYYSFKGIPPKGFYNNPINQLFLIHIFSLALNSKVPCIYKLTHFCSNITEIQII